MGMATATVEVARLFRRPVPHACPNHREGPGGLLRRRQALIHAPAVPKPTLPYRG